MAVDAKALEAGGAFQVVLTLLPVVLGGISSYFNLFVESPKEFRARVSLTRQKLLEGVNERLSALLRGVVDVSTGTNDVLRGDGMQAPDLVGDFTEEQFRSFSLLHRLLNTERFLQWGHKILLLTTMAGIIVFVVAMLAASWRWLLVYLTVALVVVQIATIASVYGYSRRLDDLEDLS